MRGDKASDFLEKMPPLPTYSNRMALSEEIGELCTKLAASLDSEERAQKELDECSATVAEVSSLLKMKIEELDSRLLNVLEF